MRPDGLEYEQAAQNLNGMFPSLAWEPELKVSFIGRVLRA